MSFIQLIFPLTSPYIHGNDVHSSTLGRENFFKLLSQLVSEKCDQVVIGGPDNADKTALAFQAAVSGAASGEMVTHISTHPLKRLPIPVHGMVAPEAGVMRNVDFLYLEDSSDLIGWFASVHTKTKLPSLIIIEDILSYASHLNDGNIERSLARLCATISNAVTWIVANNEMKRCQVLMTAPTRITSLSSILSQFDYRIASYQGPDKDENSSRLNHDGNGISVDVKFSRRNDCLVLTDVELHQT